MPRYNPAVVEPKWQKFWEENRTFACPKLPKDRKLYVLDMFPYPSGDGLHVGHPEGYTATDIVCRYQRMKGTSVMHPMGWDAFGLPAEQHAKKTGTHPRSTTEKNIATFRRQLKMLGFSYDWQRELATTDVGYFRWTQCIFLLLFDTWFDETQQRGRPIAELPIPEEVTDEGARAVERYRDEHRLAYQLEAPVNWCPALGTVLANEEVIGRLSERGGHPVVRIPLRQWMLRITAYADRLEKDLDKLDWPEGIKHLQRNWIGRSTGAEVDFFIGTLLGRRRPSVARRNIEGWLVDRKIAGWPRKPDEGVLRIYTTRPDTLFGTTYMVIAPEHPLCRAAHHAGAVRSGPGVLRAVGPQERPRPYRLGQGKDGRVHRLVCHQPRQWRGDSHLGGRLRAHQLRHGRDHGRARPRHPRLRVCQAVRSADLAVVDPGDAVGVGPRRGCWDGSAAFIADGTAINSGPYNGLSTPEFKQKIAEDLAARASAGRRSTTSCATGSSAGSISGASRSRSCTSWTRRANRTGRIRALEPEDLPLDLPEKMDSTPSTTSPTPPLGQGPARLALRHARRRRYKRETNTMPQWAGSCWYYLRFLDPKNSQALVDPAMEKAWMPVDLYVGGAEHAVLHLLYARFWHKVLFDRGYVSTAEPFHKLVNQGMILGENGEKMSKSRGNVVNPDEVVKEYGPTSLRLYERDFHGPAWRAVKMSNRGAWTACESGVRGLRSGPRAWPGHGCLDDRAGGMSRSTRPSGGDVEPTAEQNRMLHKTIKAVTDDLEHMSFNTAIARMMEFTNFFLKSDVRPRAAMEKLVLLLAPLAPHIAEELWQALGHAGTLAYEPWPTFDAAAIREDTIEVPVQVNGKLRGRVSVPADADKAALEAAARGDAKVAEMLAGKTVLKTIVVPGRMVNFVVK